jgi:hypothetical protein
MMNKNTKIVVTLVVLVAIAGGSFYGGMIYGKSSNKRSVFSFQGQGTPTGMSGTNGASKQGGNIGEIISKDDKSITIKLTDGGSKIIFFASTTEISKSATGSVSDLAVGANVVVQGTTNSDGGVTAKTIQIRPAGASQPDMPANGAQNVPAQPAQ